MAESADGYIWLVSRDGLTRFDGLSFHTIYPAINALGKKNAFRAVLSFQDRLWVGARGYIGFSTPDAFGSFTNPRFSITPLPRGVGDAFGVSSLFPAPEGGVVFHRSDGIYQLFAKGGAAVLLYPPPSGLPILEHFLT